MPEPDELFRSRHRLAQQVEVQQRPGRPHLALASWPKRVYAIGDPHGCLDLVQALMNRIIDDAGADKDDTLAVFLGDYVDRGPQSMQLLDWLLDPATAPLPRICLAGNHEDMMADFLDRPDLSSPWLANGGLATLESYGLDLENTALGTAPDALRSVIPDDHRRFVAGAPAMLALPSTIFAHAGVRPGHAITAQSDHDLLWIRHDFYRNADQLDYRVVHGHTPCDIPLLLPQRICVDTGAFMTGKLTSVCLTQSLEPYFLNS